MIDQNNELIDECKE